MVGLERFIAWFTVAQAIVATLRASSRAFYLLRKDGRLDGPLILPPSANETNARRRRRQQRSANLWELVTAFRRGVQVALDRDDFPGDVVYEISDLATSAEIKALVASPSTTSTRPLESRSPAVQALVSAATDEDRDKDIDCLLEDYESEQQLNSQNDQDTLVTASDFFFTLSTMTTISSPSQRDQIPRVAQVKAYAPDCFAELRSLFGVSEREYQSSLIDSGPYVSFQSNSKGAARVGGVFFLTRDGGYLIKTIKEDEVVTLLKMLPRYYRFMKKNGRRTLLTRFCGMYEVEFAGEKPRTFVVMNSVFPAESSKFLTERFDLKGSSIGREVSMQEKESKGADAILKDLDLAREVELVRSLQEESEIFLASLPKQPRRRKDQGYGIHIGSAAKSRFMEQIRRDVEFLVDCGVIDYSLLVGVAKEKMPFQNARVNRILVRGQKGERILKQLEKEAGKSNTTATKTIDNALASALLAPVRLVVTPALRVSSRFISLLLANDVQPRFSFESSERLCHSSGSCVVDGGPFAKLHGYRSHCPAVYYFGLIDFLQPYNMKKVLEYRAKSLLHHNHHGKEGETFAPFSCVPPEEYADRFLKFLDKHIV